MALYGFLVSAPLGHVLVGLLQKAFAGRTGKRARVGQILASNLLVTPVLAGGECSCLVVACFSAGVVLRLRVFGLSRWC